MEIRDSVKRVKSDNLHTLSPTTRLRSLSTAISQNAASNQERQDISKSLTSARPVPSKMKNRKTFSRTSSVVTARFKKKHPAERLKLRSDFASQNETKESRRKVSNATKDIFYLPTAFANMLFDDENIYLAKFLLLKGEPDVRSTVKALLELAIVEDCAAKFSFLMLEHQLEDEGKITTSPNIEIIINQQKVTFNQPPSIMPFVIAQQFVLMKCSMIVKRIDISTNKTILAAANGKIYRLSQEEHENEQPPQIDLPNECSKSILNEKHQFYELLKITFPEAENYQKALADLLIVSKIILMNVAAYVNSDVPFDVTELINFFGELAEQKKIENRDEIFFWCFVYPLITVTSFTARRRSKIAAKYNGWLALCFLIIKGACIGDIEFISELSENDKESLDGIRKTFYSIIKICALKHEKDLGDTILHFCSVTDETKPLHQLVEIVHQNLPVIWNELMQDPEHHRFLLMQMIPFIRCGFNIA